MRINNWDLFYFTLFAERLTQLEQDVTALAIADPQGYVGHPKAKLLRAVVESITTDVPANPDHEKFRLGKMLDAYSNWRRVKRGLPPRYRLFFKFTSAQHKVVYAWLNDDSTLRKDSDKNDVYEVFKRLLRRGDVPDSIEELLRRARPAELSKGA